MRVLMMSWEYPPLVVGGIAAHVDGLARALVRAGHEVAVLSLHHPTEPDDAVVDGVRVLRADPRLPWLPDDDLVARVSSANHHLTRLLPRLGDWRPDVVHAHDWLTAWAGDTAAALFGAPLVATVHATERGRHGGHLPPGLPGSVNAVEWWLTYQARELIACSRFMVREVVSDFELPPGKVHLVPNGIDLDRWRRTTERSGDTPPLVVAWGRIQYEKGFQVLARAIGALRHRVPGIRCVIAGRGSYLPELQTHIEIEGVGDLVHLAGFVDDTELRALLADAACVVIPSLYEPFGIVALEGMAAGAPVVAARTGGLAETLEGTGAGVLFEPGDHHGLADAIARLVEHPGDAARLVADAGRLLEGQYTWDAIAGATIEVYRTSLAPPVWVG